MVIHTRYSAEPKGGTGAMELEQTTKILDVIAELEKAVGKHIEWLTNLHKMIVCNLPVPPQILDEEVHLKCDFGKWYYLHETSFPNQQEQFQKIGQFHLRIHDSARQMLLTVQNKQAVAPEEYDEFMYLVSVFNELLRKLQSDVWRQISIKDALTGLDNRHGMMKRLDSAMTLYGGKSHAGCICLCDVDHFKQVNDKHGHQAGDEVLKSIGKILTEHIRPSDLVFRYGGEEFLIFFVNVPEMEALMICERLRENIGSTQVPVNGDTVIKVTASFGIAQVEVDKALEKIIKRADEALYNAKAAGRNRTMVYSG